LVDVRGFVDSLKTENANLKAEKTLLKVCGCRLWWLIIEYRTTIAEGQRSTVE
jgi:hypothetical protein